MSIPQRPPNAASIVDFAASLIHQPAAVFTTNSPTAIYSCPPFEVRYTAACLVGTRRAWLFTLADKQNNKQFHLYIYANEKATGEQIRATLAKYGRFGPDQGYTRTVELLDN